MPTNIKIEERKIINIKTNPSNLKSVGARRTLFRDENVFKFILRIPEQVQCE